MLPFRNRTLSVLLFDALLFRHRLLDGVIKQPIKLRLGDMHDVLNLPPTGAEYRVASTRRRLHARTRFHGVNAFVTPSRAGRKSGKCRRSNDPMLASSIHFSPSGVYIAGV